VSEREPHRRVCFFHPNPVTQTHTTVVMAIANRYHKLNSMANFHYASPSL